MSKFLNTFIALQSSNYRKYFVVNGISMMGNWMQRLAMSWLVYRITESATWLGIINFAGWFTAFLVMPWAGVFLDTFSRRKLLVFAQLTGIFQSVALAWLTFAGTIQIWHIVFLSVALGLVNGFDMPGRHAFVSDLVTEKKMLANAIALNSTLFNLARLIGPAIAGIIVARYGEGACFLINGITFFPAAIILTLMNIKEKKSRNTSDSFISGIKEGISYAWKHEGISIVLIMLSIASLMGMSMNVLHPVLAKDVLGGNSETLGFLTGAMGLGAVVGALWLASRSSAVGMGRIIMFAFGGYGSLAVVLAWSEIFEFSLLLMFLMGICVVCGWSSSNTVLQTISDKGKRSRVMSIYLMCFSGMSPIGGLLMGRLASQFHVSIAMTIGGGTLLLSVFVLSFYLKKVEDSILVAEG